MYWSSAWLIFEMKSFGISNLLVAEPPGYWDIRPQLTEAVRGSQQEGAHTREKGGTADRLRRFAMARGRMPRLVSDDF